MNCSNIISSECGCEFGNLLNGVAVDIDPFHESDVVDLLEVEEDSEICVSNSVLVLVVILDIFLEANLVIEASNHLGFHS